MINEIPNWLKTVLLLIFVALLAGLVYANYQFTLNSPGGNDFLARWMGARYWLVEGVNPYDSEVSLASQRMIYGRPADPSAGEDVAHFVYPLPAMIFFAPFGLFSYPLARALWMTILEINLPILAFLSIAVARWKPSRWLLGFFILFSIIWYHGLRAVIVGQFAILEAVLLIGALLAIQRDADALAGILLGLSIAKPQMAYLLIPFVLFWALSVRRWQIILWTVGTLTVLIGGSIWIMPDWPIRWLQQLVDYPNYTSLGSPISITLSILPRGNRTLTLLVSGLLLLYMLWEWFRASGKDLPWFQWTAAVTLVITNLVSLRTATTNYVVLLLALVIAFRAWEDRWPGGRWFTWIITVTVLIGLWVLFIVTVDDNIEAPIMYLPLPYLSLVVLLWTRWWTVKTTRMPALSR
ncbi:MAG: glycosyltransferase family 87 protein [Anaerolineales bacterium]